MYFIASMSLYCEQQKLHSLEETSDFFVAKNVYLYDVTESGMRDMELDAFYSFYLSQAQFEKTPKSVILHRIHYFDFREIMRVYKMFEIANYSEIESDIIFMRLQEFFNSLQFLPRYDSLTSSGYFNKPLTLYECLNIERFAGQSSAQDCRGFVSNWLQLLSWWRLANVRLQETYKQIYHLMRLRKSRMSSRLCSKIAESFINLDALMANLDLHHGSAELAALRQCFSLSRNIPNGRVFVPNYECNFGAPKDILFCNISEDSKLIAFVVGCSFHNINICFMIQRVIVCKLEDADLLENIARALKPLTVEFFFDVICPLRIGVKFDTYIVSVFESCMGNFEQYALALKKSRDGNEIVENTLEHTIHVWIRTLKHCIDISLHDNQILTFFQDEAKAVITNSIEQLVSDVLRNGVFLAYKVFQNDFVTENILLELAIHQLKAHNAGLFEVSCAQVAYSLVSAYKIMHNKSPYPEGCFWQPESFPRREFVAFIDELRGTCGLQRLGTENASTRLDHWLQEMQHSLSSGLRKELHDLTVLAQQGNELLDKAKYFQDLENS
ncbi:hypothetical protein HNY73_006539 [Argiope bruennichi]|uniref:Uncharacterized protein n=2 Tax=Argiope bruennichi TaxID=94029 RepID=A0A8T0FBG5_ARGBR|nr:hypothetical protein HNY73_006539 [Argiope bruennichi]